MTGGVKRSHRDNEKTEMNALSAYRNTWALEKALAGGELKTEKIHIKRRRISVQ